MKNRLVSLASFRRSVWILLTAVSALPLLGCGLSQEAAVSGTVTLDGKPLQKGMISFYPAEKGPIGYGNIQPDGSYSLRTGSQSGIPAGEYIVTVVAYNDPPPGQVERMPTLLTPARYAEKSKSDLRYDVTPGSNAIDVAITSKEGGA